MFIRFTSVVAGSEAESEYSSPDRQMISMDFAEKSGLFKYNAWMHDIKIGDTLVIGKDIAAKLPEISKDKFTYEEVQAKYMNKHYYSDVRPYEVIKWISPTRVQLREMKTARQGETDTIDILPDPEQEIFEVRMHKNGGFYDPDTNSCPYIPSETPHYYYDLSF